MPNAFHRALVVGLLWVGLGGCDLATEAPDFSVSPDVDAPLVTEQSFVLVGPDSTERTPLIDTTGVTDSLFSVSPDDQSVLLTKEVAVLDDRVGRLLPSLSVGAGSLSVAARRFLPRQLGASFGDSIGVRTRPAVQTPVLPVRREDGVLLVSGPDAAPTAPSHSLLDTDADVVQAITLSRGAEGVNRYAFTLRNGLDQTLISADRAGGPPTLVVESPEGDEIARGRFDTVPAPGQRVQADVGVEGKRLPRPVRFRLDATTPVGLDPLLDRPEAVQVATSAAPFEIVETTLRRIPEQSPTPLSLPTVSLDAGTGVSGFVVRDGTATLTLRNSLPYALRVSAFHLENRASVGPFPAGTRPIEGGPVRIPARSDRTVEVELGRTAFSSTVAPAITVEGEATDGPIDVSATDGLDVEVALSFDLETLFMRPDGQRVRGRGRLPLRSRKIRFDAPDDFVTLERGTLRFDPIRNELPAGIDPLRVTFPSVLDSPHRPDDSLTVRFGRSDAPSAPRQFPLIPPEDELTGADVDLGGLRVELPGSTMPFEGSVRLARRPEVQAFSPDDRLAVGPQFRDLSLRGLRADVAPLTTLLPTDRDGDRTLDLAEEAEARVFDAGRFHRIGGTKVTALDLDDTKIRLSVSTNVGAEAVLYLAVLGRRTDGREAFLSGRGPLAVPEADTTAESLQRNGAPIDRDRLLRIPLSGSSSPEDVRTEVVELTSSTAALPDFLRLLPDEMRVVGRLVVQPEGGRVQLQKPITFRLRFGLAQPFRVGGDVAFTQTVDADLGGLEVLTDSTQRVSLNRVGLSVPYENGLPVSTDLRLDVLDDRSAPIAHIPPSDADSIRFGAAPTSSIGTASGTTTGTVPVQQSRTEIERLQDGSALRIRVRLQSPRNRSAVLRASDGFSLRVEGRADLRVDASN